MTERIAVVGARDASPETLEKVRAYILALPAKTVVISGGAQGVDTTASTTAFECGLESIEYIVEPTGPMLARLTVAFVRNGSRHDRPAWEFHRGEAYRTALLFRNTCIVGDCQRMVAFVTGSKGGTWDAVKQAERFKRPVEVIR